MKSDPWELLRRGQQGDKAAFDEFFESNMPLVKKALHKFSFDPIHRDDLEQEGYIGLLVACRGFDCDSKYQFSTYAMKCISGKIMSALNRPGIITHIRVQENARNAIRDLIKFRRECDETDIGSERKHLESLGHRLVAINLALRWNGIVSMSTPISESQSEEFTLLDTLDSGYDLEDHVEFRERLRGVCDQGKFANQHSEIVWLRMCGYMIKEIAEKFGVTKQSVDSRIHRAKEHYLDDLSAS